MCGTLLESSWYKHYEFEMKIADLYALSYLYAKWIQDYFDIFLMLLIRLLTLKIEVKRWYQQNVSVQQFMKGCLELPSMK